MSGLESGAGNQQTGENPQGRKPAPNFLPIRNNNPNPPSAAVGQAQPGISQTNQVPVVQHILPVNQAYSNQIPIQSSANNYQTGQSSQSLYQTGQQPFVNPQQVLSNYAQTDYANPGYQQPRSQWQYSAEGVLDVANLSWRSSWIMPGKFAGEEKFRTLRTNK